MKNSNPDPIVIVSAARTPIGSMLGQLSQISAVDLGAVCIQAVLEHAKDQQKLINEVLMGCVLSAGCGQAPARQAMLGAGLSENISATTINKMCGSGLQAILLGHDRILAGTSQAVIAGGLENMSAAPFLLPKARQGYRLGHAELIDHLMLDGLEDAYNKRTAMGVFAEKTAEMFNITREQQDDYALISFERAKRASESGKFQAEITPVTVTNKREKTQITDDEGLTRFKPEKLISLSPVFQQGGTVTAGNASPISDGAAAVSLMRRSIAEKAGLTPMATIIAHHSVSQAPEWFTTAPALAIKALLEKCQWHKDDVDLYEINEAFAVVALHAMQQCGLDHERVNIHGGACVLGHPIGASGARIVVTLLHALSEHQLKRGVAALCIGGGEAVSIAVERFE